MDTRRRVWPAVVAVQLGVLLAALEATIVGTAMPTIIAALGGAHLYPWLFSAYMLATTVVMPVFGGLSDRLGRRGPYVAAIVLFSLGALVAGAAPTMPVMVVGRGVQGIGAGGILSLSMIIFGDMFAGPRRGRMQGYITAVWGVSSIVGPLLGGVIVDRVSWRWVFLLNLPLGAVVALLALAALPPAAGPARRARLDLPGAAAFLVGVTALMLAVLEPGGGASPLRLGALAVAGLGLALFVRVERRSRDPLLPLGLLGERPFAAGSAAAFFSGAAMFGALVHLPILIQWGQGTDATTAGLSLMTMSTGWSAGGLFAGQVLHRVGFRGLTVAGAALMSVGYTGLALRPGMSWAGLLTVGGLVGIGMGLLSITLVLTVQTVIAPVRRGVATAGILFFRNIGATLGVAVMGAMLTARLGVRLAGLGEGGGGDVPSPLAAALVDGMGAVFWVGASATVLGLVATGFLPGRARRAEPLPVPEDLAG